MMSEDTGGSTPTIKFRGTPEELDALREAMRESQSALVTGYLLDASIIPGNGAPLPGPIGNGPNGPAIGTGIADAGSSWMDRVLRWLGLAAPARPAPAEMREPRLVVPLSALPGATPNHQVAALERLLEDAMQALRLSNEALAQTNLRADVAITDLKDALKVENDYRHLRLEVLRLAELADDPTMLALPIPVQARAVLNQVAALDGGRFS